MTSAFKFTACAVALALTSADTTLMASTNPTTAPATTGTTAPTNTAAAPPATNNSATIIPANSDAPGSLVANATAASAYGNFMKDYQDAVEGHKDEIAQWEQKFAQDHKELIADGMKMVQKLQADSAALSKDGTGNRTAVQEKVQKLRGAVHEQVKQYFADPKHEQQLDAIRDEIKALVAKHIPDVKAWVAEHKADVLAYLKKVTGDVEAGRIPPAYDCDITEQMGITQPDAQAYMKEHGAEVEANIKKFEAARDAFVKAHQQQILKVLNAVTKMVETGEYHLSDEAKGALLNKWKGMQEDGGNDADADAGANAGADINTNTTTYAAPAPSSRRLRGRF